jgi:hypothetical protein
MQCCLLSVSVLLNNILKQKMKTTQKKTSKVLLAFVPLLFVWGCASTRKTITPAATSKSKSEQGANQTKPKDGKLKRAQTEENMKLDAKSTLKIMKENAPKVRLNEYFEAIANADNAASADRTITKALAMFASPEAKVLLVVSEQNGTNDYDKPATIRAYFNYLKIQKKNLDDIKNLKIDPNGKITEVELRKNNLVPLQ